MKRLVDYDFNTYVNFPVYSASYCALDSLLSLFSPQLYHGDDVCGWAYDVYLFSDVDQFAITTGYSPVGITIPKSVCERYNRLAKKILSDFQYSENAKEHILSCIHVMVNEVAEMNE